MSFDLEIAAARASMGVGNLEAAMRHLERAHVIGQLRVWPHVLSHWLMLRLELRRGRPAAAFGQLVRIVLGALGSVLNVVPTGNTGGSDIGMFQRLPVAPELQAAIDAQPRGKPARAGAVLALVLALLAMAWLAGCASPPAAPAMPEGCGPGAPEKFEAFLPRYMSDRAFAAGRTVVPLESLEGPQRGKSLLTREQVAQAVLLADIIKADQLSTRQSATPGGVELNVFKRDADSHMYYYRFRQQNGCWFLWQFEDASL